ncbi:hypothetical protein KJ912_03185, partial [Patescibacteria group bacterium]|nr:hypothetical protein [Patescibacteria group bacterium]
NEWQVKKYIKKIRRGYYIFADRSLNEEVLFLIANKIYTPSYVSFEMAFSYYNLIPEGVYSITSATSRKTNKFRFDQGKFIYHHLKPELLFGYKLTTYQNHNFKIAEIEKALLDFLYINPNLKEENDFVGLRFNSENFIQRADKKKLEDYIAAFQNKSLERRLRKFLKFINYA